jgi:hypothetical protein
MSDTANRIFVSIGVSKPNDLARLPGAISAAEGMAQWARDNGYLTLLLHDEMVPEITIDILRVRITELITGVTKRTDLKRLVIYFAGHGASLGVGDIYWVLTNWNKRTTEAIRVISLQRMLEFFGPEQVSVIGDTCQEFTARFMDLDGSAVLDRPEPAEDRRRFELDRFFASDAGLQAFMIKASGEGDKDFCLFTEVLLDALEGDARDVYYEDVDERRLVTSQSLTKYLERVVAIEAGRHGVRMTPSLSPGFWSDRTYLTITGRQSQLGGLDHILSSNDKPTLPGGELGGLLGEVGAIQGGLGGVLGGGSRVLKSASPHSLRRVRPELQPRDNMSEPHMASDSLERELRRVEIFEELRSVGVLAKLHEGCGLSVSGVKVKKIQLANGELVRVHRQPEWYEVRLDPGVDDRYVWSDTLITLKDGRILSACVVKNFFTSAHFSDPATLSLWHSSIEERTSVLSTLEVLADLHAGQLNEKNIIGIGAAMRHGKHRVMTKGCIAAQFYDAIRDIDSLRSIAAFYAKRRQPVPLDIILYGGGTISEVDEKLYACIPAVKRRQPRTEEESRHPFTYEDTPVFSQHPIAGRVPWMRQAWSALETVSCDPSARAWREQAMRASKFLTPGTFTVLRSEGAAALARLAGISIKRIEPVPEMV